MALWSRSAAWFLALGLALGLASLAGCARPTLEVGPDAARLKVDFAAQVPPGKVNSYDMWRSFPRTSRSRFRSSYGPYWRLKMVTFDSQGKEVNLPPAPGQARDLPRGAQVQGSRIFMISPGSHKVRASLCAEMRLVWQERTSSGRGYHVRDARGRTVRVYEEPIWQERSRVVTLACFERELEVAARPNGEITLEFKPGPAGAAGGRD